MISVVIPLFNKESCIANTLDSVLNQSFCDFEAIVVDDGSTDASPIIVSSIADNRVRLVTQRNGGPSSARNRGIKEAKYDYVAFLDADDLWAPVFLEEMVHLIRRFPDAHCWGFNYSVIKERKAMTLEQKGDSGYIDSKWKFSYFPFCSSSCCCRKSSLMELGGFDERIMYGEDLDMWFRLLLTGRGVRDTRVMAFYNQDIPNSLMQKQRIPLEKHIPFFIDKYADARKDNVDFRRYFDEQMVYRLYPYLFDKEYKETARSLSEKLDFSLLKLSMKFRIDYPYIYRYLRRIKDTIKM